MSGTGTESRGGLEISGLTGRLVLGPGAPTG